MNIRNSSLLLIIILLSSCSQKLPLDKWTYVEIDNDRAKWGDFAEPEWLRYFGLDCADTNDDGKVEIVSGRYFYKSQSDDMTSWERIDLGLNADGCLFIDVDGDESTDIIASALPDIYWLEANDAEETSWTVTKIGDLPPTGHNNGQGYCAADFIAGSKKEIMLQADEGIFACEIPANPTDEKEWQWNMIVTSGSDEGIGVGDMDGDGDLDIAFGEIKAGETEHPTVLDWADIPALLT